MDIIATKDDASIMEIFESVKNTGTFDSLFESIRNDPDSDGDIFKYITSSVGIQSIVEVVKNKTS